MTYLKPPLILENLGGGNLEAGLSQSLMFNFCFGATKWLVWISHDPRKTVVRKKKKKVIIKINSVIRRFGSVTIFCMILSDGCMPLSSFTDK